MQMPWGQDLNYAFPPFCLIGRVLAKVQRDRADMIIITPAWQTQAWFPKLLEMSIKHPLILPDIPNLLTNPLGEIHPLVKNKTLKLVAWTVSGKSYLQREFQEGLQISSQKQGTNANYESAWRRWSNWCDKQQVDPFSCDLTLILDYLAEFFESGLGFNGIASQRSTMSAYHDPIKGTPVGQHPRVSADGRDI